MKPRSLARSMATIVIGAMIAVAIYLDHLKRGHLTREQFLAAEAARFDKHFVVGDSLLSLLIAGIFIAGVFVGIYELLVLCFSKVIPGRHADQPVSEDAPNNRWREP